MEYVYRTNSLNANVSILREFRDSDNAEKTVAPPYMVELIFWVVLISNSFEMYGEDERNIGG